LLTQRQPNIKIQRPGAEVLGEFNGCLPAADLGVGLTGKSLTIMKDRRRRLQPLMAAFMSLPFTRKWLTGEEYEH